MSTSVEIENLRGEVGALVEENRVAELELASVEVENLRGKVGALVEENRVAELELAKSKASRLAEKFKRRLLAEKEEGFKEQINGLNERIGELKAESTKYIDIATGAVEEIERLKTERDDDRKKIELLRKYLDECENGGFIDYVNTLALDRVAAATAALVLGTAAAASVAV